MSKTEFNSYLMKAILHILKQFFRQKHRSDCKKHGVDVKLILNNLLSTRDYDVLYPVLIQYSLSSTALSSTFFIQYSLSSYTADSRLGANAPR